MELIRPLGTCAGIVCATAMSDREQGDREMDVLRPEAFVTVLILVVRVDQRC